MWMFKPILIFFFLLCFTSGAQGQKQLLLMKGEKVLLRLYPGDEFVYKEKGKSVRTTYINNLSDTAVVTHRDTVAFHEIEKVYFRQHKFYNTLGTALVVFGAGLFLIDQINVVLVQGHSPSLDNNVSTLSLSSLGVGLPLMLIRKRSQKINYRHKLMMADKGSVFYEPDTREYILPYGNN
jgi:hypothetical protein